MDYKYDNLFDAIGLETVWVLDAPRRKMARIVIDKERWLREPQLVAALPTHIVLMFRRGVMQAHGARLPTPVVRPPIEFIRDRPPSSRN